MQILSKKEIYQKVKDKIDILLNGTKIQNAPDDFPMKRGMYWNISKFLEGKKGYEKKLYNPTTLSNLCQTLGIADQVTQGTFFILA